MSDQRGNYNQGPNGSYNSGGANGSNGAYQGGGSNEYQRQYSRGYTNGQGRGGYSSQGYNNQGAQGNYQGQGNYGPQGNYGAQGGYGGPNGRGPNQGNGGQNPGGPIPAMVQVPWDQYELRKKKTHGAVCNALLSIGSAITFARNLVFNLIFVLLMFFIFGGYMAVQSFKNSGFSLSTNTIEQIESNGAKAQVLYFDLNGPISEIPFSSNQLDSLQREIQYSLYGQQSHELVAIEKALNLVARDKEIKKVIISIDGMSPISLSVAERIGKAMELAKNKDFDREVVVVGIDFDQSAYALAAHADKIVMDTLGTVGLRGIAMSSLYFKDMLDKANLTPYIFRAGHFKSAVEPFMLNGMSYDVRREYQAIAYKSWDIYKKSIAVRKGIKTTEVLPDANVYVNWIARYKGDRGELQLAQGLIDEIRPIDEYYQQLSEELNADYHTPYRPAIITYQDYLLRHHVRATGSSKVGALSQIDVPQQSASLASVDVTESVASATKAAASAGKAVVKAASDNVTSAATNAARAALGYQIDPRAEEEQAPDLVFNQNIAISEAKKQIERRLKNKSVPKGYGQVAVIYGIGEIVDQGEKATDFTFDNIVPLIEEAQNDDSINAVVLYLNSPGGSVLASEQIRRALETFQKYSLKPLVVSMNGTAASGAYWIGSQAERIFATKSTITGSIGVFGLTFSAHKLLNKYGAYQDGVVTNELALTAIAKEMPNSQQNILNMSVENTYKQFVELVARNRGLKPNDYQIYAEGQIFLADDAKSIGLVDEIGDLSDAITYAAAQANIKPGNVHVKHMAPGNQSLSGFEGIIFGMSNAFLPQEFTYALIEMRKNLKYVKTDGSTSLMAISPISEPKL